jgi:alginate O-acetyltransferase complex protein AlgI
MNHGWLKLKNIFSPQKTESLVKTFLARIITFISVVIGWVFFRADTIQTAFIILKGMCGLNGISLSMNMANILQRFHLKGILFDGIWPHFQDPQKLFVLIVIIGLLFVTWLAPNAIQFLNYRTSFSEMNNDDISLNNSISLSWRWGIACGILLALGVSAITRTSEFLYWNF